MVRINQLNDRVKEIKKSFINLTKHTYLDKYIQVPVIDEDKIRLLYTMLSEHTSKKDAKIFTLSALLVHAALDVHEAVSLHKIQSESLRKHRQLTVLAGDYYCSLYYFLLAEGKHISAIQVFSHSIQEINEHKMNLYHTQTSSFEEYKENVEKVESMLLQNIAEHFNQSIWKQVYNDFFFLKRLVFERNEFKNGNHSYLVQSMYEEAKHPDVLLQLCEQKIEDVKDRLLKAGKKLEKFEGFIIEHVDQLISTTTDYEETVAEEG
ncbi:heptaprenyl diphosphate synthase component 1 [Bacillus sp. FJAT-45037]|uniref:heptaprenyl diphosphate synthase component 1 n=1 Tax=Bacillus sp. FJAT-45037 TaxID=2011007 RepID=UPI000C23CBB2|nr:heptaprenyl diphosphate synthase component 1 [Bacillus sp. FJAT-45037]